MGPKRRSQPKNERVLASNAHLYCFTYILLIGLSFLFISGPTGGEAMTSFKMCLGVARHSRPSAALQYQIGDNCHLHQCKLYLAAR